VRRRIGSLGLATLALLLAGAPAAAADPAVADDANVLAEPYRESIQAAVDAWAQLNDGRMLVVTRLAEMPNRDTARGVAEARLPSLGGGSDAVLIVDVAAGGCPGAGGLAMTHDVAAEITDEEATYVLDELDEWVGRCQVGPGAAIAASRLLSFALTDGPVPTFEPDLPPAPLSSGGGTTIASGPPFPPPIEGQAVYDNAGVFRADKIATAEKTIDAIEERVGAEVVVYSQVVEYGITTEEADAHAQALMDQWGVGRLGFDDGLVILFDVDPSLVHGQVQLYGGPGYRAAYLDNSEKQRIFDEEMLPLLREEDMDGALLIALQRVDENATPEHANRLQVARQVDAAVGLVGAPLVLVGLIGSAAFAWLRYGKDPTYLDDPSIHMAGPPEGLTPAAATFVLNGGPSRRALTAAMLDLASRGLIAFREQSGFLGINRKVGVELDPGVADDNERARQARNASRPLGPAEKVAHRRLAAIDTAEQNYIAPDELLKFGAAVDDFNKALESHTLDQGWFREKPSKATTRWSLRGILALVGAAVAFIAGVNLPSSGLMLIAGALAVGGAVVLVLSRFMTAVTLPGAMIRAMLAAYRRTLEKTMAQARSMDEVVAAANLAWLDTPDKAVVWGTALGLEKDVEEVLERSLSDIKDGRATIGSTYLPAWYGSGAGGAHGFAGSGGGGGGGLFSSSAIPSIGGMMGALSSIGNSPSSSGSGGGGFGGGGSGGGGGGSGGGF
jgi:uncharacterized membrane protein YgcG